MGTLSSIAGAISDPIDAIVDKATPARRLVAAHIVNVVAY
jgi:hypothetical protein